MTESKVSSRIIGFSLALAFAASTLHPSPTSAQEGSITISAADYFHLCTLQDDGPGVKTLYILHRFNTGSTAARFKVEAGPGATLTYLSEVHHFASTQGNSQDGIAVCYGSCAVGDQLVATISYMSYGTSGNCSQMLVVPHPSAQTVEAIRCDSVPVRTFVRDLFVVRVLGDCGCPNAHSFPGTAQSFGCGPVPVTASTWGAIKALYR